MVDWRCKKKGGGGKLIMTHAHRNKLKGTAPHVFHSFFFFFPFPFFYRDKIAT